jgi:phosphohistidine phosphatase SixA
VPVHLVRHACAGDKTRWAGPDLDRPLDEAGVEQAAALAASFESVPVERVLTSPARRCRQTVEPLARGHGVPVELLPGLLPDGDPEYVHGLVAALDAEGSGAAGASIVCTHGETMRPLLATVRQGDRKIVAMRDDDDWLLRKGTGWELTLNGNGTIVALRHLVPDAMHTCPAHDPLVS